MTATMKKMDRSARCNKITEIQRQKSEINTEVVSVYGEHVMSRGQVSVLLSVFTEEACESTERASCVACA